jgi:pSer/pThr/pTyr-binding forkhead associated (FHA) protein
LKQSKSGEIPSGKTKTIIVEVMNGPEDGRVIVCEEMPISIGRTTDNLVRLSYDHLISRHHASVRKLEDKFVLFDLNSTNGTFVGTKRVKKNVPIKPHMLFRVGSTLLRMRVLPPANAISD